MQRRDFLRVMALGAAGSAAWPMHLDAWAAKPLRVGLIGSGWYGKCDLFRLIQVAPVEVVSLCDVDKQLLADAATQVAARQASRKAPRTYADYRIMLAERDLDLVLIATPDHWHALTAIEAMKAGADLYLQKPISVDVAEGQAILAAALVHPRGWRAFMEYGNGIVGDMCIHMLDAVRWMLDLGMPTRIGSTGGILVDKGSKANITDTQAATFDFPGLRVVWTHRTYGDPPDPKYPWGMTFYGDKGTLKASVMSYDFVPHGDGTPVHEDVVYELEQFPEDKTEKDLERHVAPAIRAHMNDLLQAIATRGTPVADIEQGYMSTAACVLANVSMELGRSVQWDHARGMVTGDDEANRRLRRPYRSPWIHPGAA